MIPVVIVSADKEIIELVNEFKNLNIIGLLELKLDVETLGLPVLGTDDKWFEIISKYPNLKVVIAVDSTSVKERLAYHYGIESLLTIISKDAYISSSAIIGHGCLIQRGVKIMSDTRIGTACKINVNTTIHHDTVVGDFCTLAPGSQLLGRVTVEDKVFIGAGAIILPRVKVGTEVIVGAGAVVVSDVPPRITVAGVPARVLK